MSRRLNPTIDRICKFASTDETRWHLQCVYACSELKSYVATDGWRVIVSPSITMDVSFDAKTYLKTENKFPVKIEKYPNVKQFLPNLETYTQTLSMDLPEWFSSLKSKRPVAGHFSTKGISLFKSDDTICTIDLKLLIPLAGENVVFQFRDSVSPVYFKLSDQSYGCIMPMRV